MRSDRSEKRPRGTERDLLGEADDLRALYSPTYLRECAAGEARSERLAELRRRIALRAYRVDPDWVADGLLRRGALDSAD